MSRTILVTGATGYIAKHIVRLLLERGDTVVGSVRRADGDAEMRAALAPVLTSPAALDRYRSVSLDLLDDAGWDKALQGVDAMLHTASPFPMTQPKNADDLIRPAVEGTQRALRAAHAAGVRDVVVTSSTAAVMAPTDPVAVYDETVWTDPDRPDLPAYIRSKVLAERAAWEFARTESPNTRLSVINPSFVMGAPLDAHYGTSVRVIERLLGGKDPLLPRLGFSTCHVKDVAEAHLAALDTPEADGHRHIICDRFFWFREMAQAVREAAPEAKTARHVAPDIAIRFLGLFDKSIRSIVPELGKVYDTDTTRMRNVLGITPRPAHDAVFETAQWLVSRTAGGPPRKRIDKTYTRSRELPVA